MYSPFFSVLCLLHVSFDMYKYFQNASGYAISKLRKFTNRAEHIYLIA